MKKQIKIKNNKLEVQNCISINIVFNLILSLIVFPFFCFSQSTDQNWVKTKTYKTPTTTSIVAPTTAQAVTRVSYFDGLGRPIQQLTHAQSNSSKDVVTHIEYDQFGRQVREYLPFVASGTASLNIKPNEVSSFYGSNTVSLTGNPDFEITQFPYNEKQLEASTLNRVLKQSAPGETWQMGQGKEIKFDYLTNIANEVKIYKGINTWNTNAEIYDISFSDLGYYPANQLTKLIIKDENWVSGKNNTVEEFKNKDGQIILKRTYSDYKDANGNLISSQVAHDTYYVYDKYGNLTYVIPPSVSGTITQSILDNMCYQYKYDYRNRLVEKKLPGKDWQYIVYDKLDRVVANGPANAPFYQDSNKGWLITKYDFLNRAVFTAWYNAPVSGTLDRKAMQVLFNNATIFSESKATSVNTINGISVKYTNQVTPTTFTILSVNYYDNYDYPNAPSIPSQVEGQNTTTSVKGLPTGNWVRVLDVVNSNSGELSYLLYDTRHRVITSNTKNYLGGFTQVDTKLNWAGRVEYTLSNHKRTASDQLLTVKERFNYSAQDRLIKHTHEILGFLSEEVIVQNTYDELGQLISKKVGGKASRNTPVQKIDYTYNIRGWLKSINNINNLNPTTSESDLFAFKLSYESPESATPLYNGNVTETFWRTSADNLKRKYAYKYDNLNRLLEANYNKPDVSGTLDNYLEKLTYDKVGNVLTLERNGNLDPSGGATVNQIDNLVYTYHSDKKNMLMRVNDLSNSPQGFNQSNDIATGDVDQNTNDHSDDYDYDFNGNLIKDTNKGIKEIKYNHLNLPVFIKFEGVVNGTISYIYNSIGQKVKKEVYEDVNNVTTITDYLGGYQYKDAILQFFPHAEGYVHNTKPLAAQGGANSVLGNFNYVFNYTDHLGNVRVSFAKDPVDDNVVKILEENHYYPFGMKHKNYNVDHLNFDEFPETGVEIVPAPAVANATYNYKYNGKELQEELGLNMYDYGARNYMPDLGRWGNMDNHSDSYTAYSPYNYTINNPINVIDPDGNDIYIIIWASDRKNGHYGHAAIAVDNYKKVNKKDSNGNDVLDSDGNVVTEMVKDGTYTYYDLWPGVDENGDEVGDDFGEAGPGLKDSFIGMPAYYQKKIISSLSGDPSGAEGYAADGIIKLNAGYEETMETVDDLVSYMSSNKNYKSATNNCSNFALEATLEPLDKMGVFTSTGAMESYLGGYIKIVTPNQLYKYLQNIISSSPTEGRVIKSPGQKVNEKFTSDDEIKGGASNALKQIKN